MKVIFKLVYILKHLIFIHLSLLIMLGCDYFEKTFEVEVVVATSNTYTWGFGIYKNGDSIFSSTECGSGNTDASDCVEFTDNWDANFDSYVYTFEANEGDKIGVLANSPVFSSCNANFSTWIYADGGLQESDIATATINSDNTCSYISSCEVVL